MKYIIIDTNRNNKIELTEGTILKFLAQEFNIDTQDYNLAFEIIGNPVEDNPPIEVNFE